MLRFVLNRIAILVPMLLGVSLVVFVMLRATQGDPAMAYLRLSQIPPSDEALAFARQTLGLDRSLAAQYLAWLQDALAGDFGRSYVTGRPVLGDILYYLPATLELTAAALALALGLSLPLGIAAALRKDSALDNLVRGGSFVGVSLPNFWLGFLLVWFFSVRLGWLPPLGRGGLDRLVLPALTLSLMSLSINTRLVRTSLLENRGHRFILYARARGLPESVVVGKHMLRNSVIPVLTAAGMHLGEMLGGAVVVESVFAWPGVGRYALSAIANRDYPVLQCFMLVMTVILVLCNLAVDVLYAWVDPRIRLHGESRP